MNPRLKTIAGKIRSEHLRKKVIELLKSPSIQINGETYVGLPLETSPAGISCHHSYPSGLVEARAICHLADATDSRLNGEILNAAAYLSRRVVGQELFRMTSKEAFAIVHSKSVEGWEGAAKTVEKINRGRKRAHKT